MYICMHACKLHIICTHCRPLCVCVSYAFHWNLHKIIRERTTRTGRKSCWAQAVVVVVVLLLLDYVVAVAVAGPSLADSSTHRKHTQNPNPSIPQVPKCPNSVYGFCSCKRSAKNWCFRKFTYATIEFATRYSLSLLPRPTPTTFPLCSCLSTILAYLVSKCKCIANNCPFAAN